MSETAALPVLDLRGDVVDLARALCDVPSVSGEEAALADLVEAALRDLGHLEVLRDGDAVLARTSLGRAERVVVAGHLDTVPIAGNVPSRLSGSGEDAVLVGRGSVDMKSGVAVQLAVAAAVVEPVRDVTWVFYDHEEVESALNGLGRISREHPEWLAGDFAVLCEPSGATVEGGCQGTLRAEVVVRGRAAHAARSWTGVNAIHGAGKVLARLAAHEARVVDVDGLTYREGLNAVRIEGGIAGNVIPDRCRVEVNFRYAPDRSPAEAEAHVRSVLEGFDVRVTDNAPGARPGLQHPAAAAFVAAIGRPPAPKLGWTDVARFAAIGVPAVNFGPGDPVQAHTDGEQCPVAQIRECERALAAWLSEV
ncbi:succinyl-diaminopimelate desuccinylase [Quadrisphaera sp. DSM 44207]|uniref:succinyl-diaminopimelate desuccinylase n=1 Tax=Quadrisphaera sp. DSM 44207 TaxID=1881057 RepID=UPI00088E3974|nr:succinyl-diaminopimelate desuccinylase [Quadrisphaera sp. DSM 44207]SDQ71244.1 succinyldiaminopimelate desuccinylase [Quadrisphaera sp. DSM 44207]